MNIVKIIVAPLAGIVLLFLSLGLFFSSSRAAHQQLVDLKKVIEK